jgi:hypothetical protein
VAKASRGSSTKKPREAPLEGRGNEGDTGPGEEKPFHLAMGHGPTSYDQALSAF